MDRSVLSRLSPTLNRMRWPAFAIAVVVTSGLLAASQHPARAAHANNEYKVVILQGIASGGALQRDADGFFVDARRTRELNRLADDGWEVVAVNGGVATDHTVYLRRDPKQR